MSMIADEATLILLFESFIDNRLIDIHWAGNPEFDLCQEIACETKPRPNHQLWRQPWVSDMHV